MALNLQHQTPDEFAARFWQLVERLQQRAKTDDPLARAELGRLVWRVWSWIQAGDLTSNQVRLAFNAHFGRNLNATQWNNYVTTRLVPMKDRHLASLAEADL